MENRNFQLDTEWNMIHYPPQPNGFGVLIIGDDRNFVNKSTSFWTQNEGKKQLVESLLEKGYTIFYSNLYGKNWGSNQACQLAERLYQYVIRSEILNQKIHLIAEGMGTLTAIRLMKEMKGNIRSAVLFNPILSLKDHLEREKEHKFFFKKLCNEISVAFHLTEEEFLPFLKGRKEILLEETSSPVKIIQILHDGKSYYQSNYLKKESTEWKKKQLPIVVSYVVPEKRSALPKYIHFFFQANEKYL
ncbi:lipase family protein [Niallia nealsonii]|uniref:Hydrolase n=1 Tax=Niallia nealsonii TaxID=115979 RepID=A0A2N0Z7R0_9BACI|nr:hydrolase [Niallia nealsonii]PKG25523.1 hydrolase [Niallia nealsonii]